MKRLPASLVSVNETDEQSRVSHARMKLIEDLEILRNKTRFEDEVLRRVSGNGQLGGQYQFGTSGRETLVGADNLLKIATQIPDGRVNLSKTDLHAALEQIMRNPASSNPLLLVLPIPRARRNPGEGGSSALNAQPSDFPKTNSCSGIA